MLSRRASYRTTVSNAVINRATLRLSDPETTTKIVGNKPKYCFSLGPIGQPRCLNPHLYLNTREAYGCFEGKNLNGHWYNRCVGSSVNQPRTKQMHSEPSSAKTRGFASMSVEKQREIARKGGRAAHERGTAHEFTADEARAAGRKGGERVSANRSHMAAIGRLGGKSSAGRRATATTTSQAAGDVNSAQFAPTDSANPETAGKTVHGSHVMDGHDGRHANVE